MIESPGWAYMVLSFFIVIGPLIFVHELGHYLVGRWFGVKADAFSIGFGRELFGWSDRRGTRWKVGWLPLGGYVKFAGDMNPASTPSSDWLMLPAEERAMTFQSKALWQRFLIVAAGPLTNFLAAVLLFIGIFAVVGVPATEAVIGEVVPHSAADRAGLLSGDRILKAGNNDIRSYGELAQFAALRPGQNVELVVQRDDNRFPVSVRLDSVEHTDQFNNRARLGDLGVLPLADTVVASVVDGSAADRAGLRPGDRIVRAEEVSLHTFSQLRNFVAARPGEAVDFVIEREGEQFVASVELGSAVRAELGNDVRVGELGVYPATGRMEKKPFWQLPGLAVRATGNTLEAIVVSLGQLITAQRSVKELGGPLKIAQISGQQASLGLLSLVTLMAIISINLGFINLLPIPLLDGGHLLFYTIEGVRRKPIRPEAQEWAFKAGLAALLTLMIFVTLNDLASFGLWSRVGGLIG